MLNLLTSEIDYGPAVTVVKVQAWCPRCGRKSRRVYVEVAKQLKRVRVYCAWCRRAIDAEGDGLEV
jgi:transcription elongation factor Elf1